MSKYLEQSILPALVLGIALVAVGFIVVRELFNAAAEMEEK